ncbi:hypothetical protein FB567DRAFT_537394 [Paraphoma chrysanthemicola]|uniref:Uncharacterized protein n=1 Tax=Paraphoma chrysanthemicola TaxID=798071 RepID=A0A8K0QW43_9PLEO|nr:hypothetical protein FB567DRAFT_537394 [Paraphoma chrysanthemicola]
MKFMWRISTMPAVARTLFVDAPSRTVTAVALLGIHISETYARNISTVTAPEQHAQSPNGELFKQLPKWNRLQNEIHLCMTRIPQNVSFAAAARSFPRTHCPETNSTE